MGRFARSWDLFKTSLSVVKHDKELLWMPVLSTLASIVTVLGITGVGLAAGLWPEVSNPDGTYNVPGLLLAFVLYILLAFVTLFFNAAVVAGATVRLGGGDPTLGSCLRAAWAKAGRLLAWSVVVATVNVILQMVRERGGAAGRALSTVGGIAWNLATFFMVPILLFESEGLAGSVKRSGSLFKKTWGETVIGQGGLGLASMVFTFGAIAVAALLFLLLSPLGLVGIAVALGVGLLAVLLVAALFAVLGGVYKAALYRYATTGNAGMGFSPDQLGGAFTPK